MRYRLLSVAETELSGAAKLYEAKATGLGQEFLDEFEAVMVRIIGFPEAWRRIGAHHRRCLFRRFPYAVLYSHTEAEVLVAGVIDLRKDPEHVEQRTQTT
jgi:hypothetical protein